jgi:K+-sensing histidine kinase KdpD
MASDAVVPTSSSEADDAVSQGNGPVQTSPGLGYAVSLALVGVATLVAFIVEHIVPAPNLSLVFVLPVIVAALSFGWGPALVSAMLSVAVFDFFFVPPIMSFRVASPTDLWALGLLLVVAAIASTVGAQSRGRAVAARQAAEQAEALHSLAHAVIKAEPPKALITMAAEALGRIFKAPAVVLTEQAGTLRTTAANGAAQLSGADLEAAQWALAHDQPTRAETYPFDQATFDFWPVRTPAKPPLVLGVKFAGLAEGRPRNPDRHVDLVAAYLSAAATDAAARHR